MKPASPCRPTLPCWAALILTATSGAALAAPAPGHPFGHPVASAFAPAPHPGDTASVPALLNAVYASISGPAGPRDWDRFRALFLPEARLAAGSLRDGKAGLRQWSVGQFVAEAAPSMEKSGFYETALVSKVQRFGNVAAIFSSYASRHAPGEKPFARGINSMQFLFDGKRWWVLSIAWDAERPGNALPADMER